MPGHYSETLVVLTSQDVRYVYDVANGYAAYGHNPNALELGMSSAEACLLGAMGELAASRFYGVPYEPVFEPDGGFDLVLDGWTANVKATPYVEDPYLRVMDKLNQGCDAYVLVAVNFTSAICQMAGWLPKDELFSKPLRRLRKDLPPCRVATSAELRPCSRPPEGH